VDSHKQPISQVTAQALGVVFRVQLCLKSKEFLGMSAKRRRTTTMEDKKLFLDSDSEDELMSHFSDSDSDQDETRRHILNGVTR
jgi:hypothetical protein